MLTRDSEGHPQSVKTEVLSIPKLFKKEADLPEALTCWKRPGGKPGAALKSATQHKTGGRGKRRNNRPEKGEETRRDPRSTDNDYRSVRGGIQ